MWLRIVQNSDNFVKINLNKNKILQENNKYNKNKTTNNNNNVAKNNNSESIMNNDKDFIKSRPNKDHHSPRYKFDIINERDHEESKSETQSLEYGLSKYDKKGDINKEVKENLDEMELKTSWRKQNLRYSGACSADFNYE